MLVDDNYHYLDTTERWTLGEYATYAEALREQIKGPEGVRHIET